MFRSSPMRRASAVALLALMLSAGPALAEDDYWTTDFLSGVNGPVLSLTTFNGDLIVGGEFTVAGGVSASNIARWDGSSWHSLGSGTNGPVHALTVHLGSLHVGGYFTQAGPFTANKVARWNGSSWSTLGSGLDGTVYDLTTYNGLIATGDFQNSGGTAVSRIARWNGSSWNPLGAGLNNIGLALLTVDSTLYVGGYFTQAGGQTAYRAAAWDGVNWTAMGDGVQGGYLGAAFIYGMAYYDGEVVVAGGFDIAGSESASNVARWNGASWSALGQGIAGSGTPAPALYAVTVYNGELVVTGEFTQAGSVAASNIARWDGLAWSTLADGLDSDGYALTPRDGSLYAGGIFTTAGGNPSSGVGRWDAPAAPTGSGRVPDGSDLPGTQFRINKTVLPTFYSFSWDDSCSATDTDYAIYEGDIGDFTSHIPLTCTTEGETSAAFSLFPDSKYYLVVPRAAAQEGSYGTNSSNVQRPVSDSACDVQEILTCE